MTLTANDRSQVASAVSPFGAQDDLYSDLPNVLKNMLREYASRPDVPADLELTEHVIRNVCDQREIGSYTLDVESRLSAEIADYPFEANYQIGLDIDDLRKVVSDPNCSYPAVSLSRQQYNPSSYEVQTDKNGNTRKLRVLVMCVNHDSVLLYDPFRYGAVEDIGKIKPTEVPQKPFSNAWEGRLESTNTLWIEATEQTRLTGYNE